VRVGGRGGFLAFIFFPQKKWLLLGKNPHNAQQQFRGIHPVKLFAENHHSGKSNGDRYVVWMSRCFVVFLLVDGEVLELRVDFDL